MTRTLSLFEGYGIEIESVVVDRDTLDVRPVVDELLREASGGDTWVEDFDDGAIGWSNELVSHVVELKTNGPAPSFSGLADDFRASSSRLDARLGERWNARLMPGGMHPWMDPRTETRLWPHDHGPVYSAYDRLFDCRRHGWANVQSVHLNLPFADEDEFARLMAAARCVLPLLPALAASSPIVEGRITGMLDSRLDYYRTNSSKIPAMTGDVIPEPLFDYASYREGVFGAIDRGLVAVGADEVLHGQEWTNARGAITRFDRMAIEIRLLDAQECAAADLAVSAAVSAVVRGLVEERWSSFEEQCSRSTAGLAALLRRTIVSGPGTPLDDRAYTATFGVASSDIDAGELWKRLISESFDGPAELEQPLALILERGTLAERLLAAVDGDTSREKLRGVWGELCECLVSGRSFAP